MKAGKGYMKSGRQQDEYIPTATKKRVNPASAANVARRAKARLKNARRRRMWRQSGVWVAQGSYVHDSVSIGRFTNIMNTSHIGPCSIGSFCAIAGRLVVRSTNHSIAYANMQVSAQSEVIGSTVPVAGISRGSISIGDAAWIGDSVIVLPGASIGVGAVIGAGSVVTRPIPDFAVAAGNPARVLRMRFEQHVIDYLLAVAWWDWTTGKMARNREFFELNFTTISAADLDSIKIEP